jgi:hypothetical protein
MKAFLRSGQRDRLRGEVYAVPLAASQGPGLPIARSAAAPPTMHPVEYFTWLLPTDLSGTARPSQFKLTREQASAYPGAVCLEESREVRMQPNAARDGGPPVGVKVVAPLPKGLPSKSAG